MESEQLYHRGYCRNSYNSIASASSDEELLDGAGVIMDFHTTEDDNLLDGDAASPGTTFGHPACFVLWSRNLFRSEFSRFVPLRRVCMVLHYNLIFCIQSLFPLPVLTCSWLNREGHPEEMWEGVRWAQLLSKYEQLVLIKGVWSLLDCFLLNVQHTLHADSKRAN